MVWVIVAALVTAFSFFQNQRMLSARRAEEAALAEAVAQSYLGFHLQRVNGLIDSEQLRRKVMEAKLAHDQAMSIWIGIAGDVMPVSAFEHRDEIEATVAHFAGVTNPVMSMVPDDDDDAIAAYVQALMQRAAKVRTIGPAGESLPLILDNTLAGVRAELKAPLLELLVRASQEQQVVLLTEDPDVADWARVEAIAGAVSVVEAGTNADSDTVDITDGGIR